MSMAEYDFSGIWKSVHHKVDSRGTAVEVSHYVTIQAIGNQLIVSGIPDDTGKSVQARFTLEGNIATGNYQSQEFTSSISKSVFYYGAAMLVLDSDGNAFRGKGVGFGKDLKVKTTAWDIIRVDPATQPFEETESNKTKE